MVIAARLSEDRAHKVLLLEAGPDYPSDVPAELLDGSGPVTSGFNWDLQALASDDPSAALVSEPMARVSRVFQRASRHLAPEQSPTRLATAQGDSGTRFRYPMGKVMGGGSAINGCLAFHARPEDYAVWKVAGNDEWGWQEVRSYLGRIEGADQEKPALSIETEPWGGMTRAQEAFLGACSEKGYYRADLRQGLVSGVGVIPMSTRQGRRVSTAALYLQPARMRPNLTLRSCCLVDRLLWGGRNGGLSATGVEAIVDGRRHRFSAGRIVLAAGAIHSPAILLRSGIGAGEEVMRLGRQPLLDLPGVGKNLRDHPAVSIWGVPRNGVCRAGEPIHQVMLQQKSTDSGPFCDLQLFMLSALRTRTLPPLQEILGAELAVGLSVVVATPRSMGRVELLDNDPTHSPRIYLNCLKEADDLRRMMEGVRSAWRLLGSHRLRSIVERVALVDQSVIDSDLLLEKMIRTTVRGAWHPVGTLRMGREGDNLAVVNQRGQLFGCGNVIVADGSIMPALPSVPTNLTCMLIAEKIADHLRGSDNRTRSRDE